MDIDLPLEVQKSIKKYIGIPISLKDLSFEGEEGAKLVKVLGDDSYKYLPSKVIEFNSESLYLFYYFIFHLTCKMHVKKRLEFCKSVTNQDILEQVYDLYSDDPKTSLRSCRILVCVDLFDDDDNYRSNRTKIQNFYKMWLDQGKSIIYFGGTNILKSFYANWFKLLLQENKTELI